jgi:hypothetical protein
MKLSRGTSLQPVTTAIAIGLSVFTVPGIAGTTQAPTAPWSVQVDKIDAGGLSIAPEFTAATYENLLDELAKTKQFSTVFRNGDRAANDVPALLILKTTIESYTPGSEAKRAVTTVAGATKLKVRTRLWTRQGQVVFESVVDGNVRFFGGNLQATHNLARNVANAIKQSPLPDPASFHEQ